ncbi:MAG: ATP-binding cassette domain-containing protein, partial [Planctomycetes bacterium]|nr:ATP-binding cassette domain-containing protein [Planctomycetota bacterium]
MTEPAIAPPPALRLRGVTKRFPGGVTANDAVDLEVAAGEIHALLGENGAGKTTLMSILYGLVTPDAGTLEVEGKPVRIGSPRAARRLGIGLVPQHFLLVPRHTVAENVALGLPETPFFFPLPPVAARLAELGARYGLPVDPAAQVAGLSAGERQRVEILKALARGARLLILDEPTSVLTPQEARALFEVLRRMARAGHAVIFITHKLEEVLAVADRITVLRRGRVVGALAAAGADRDALVRMMVGHDVAPAQAAAVGPSARPAALPLLEIDGLTVAGDAGAPALCDLTVTV